MTDSNVLADALVGAGIARKGRITRAYWLVGDERNEYEWFEHKLFEETFITDWRVAGKCLELMMAQDEYSITATGKYVHVFRYGKQVVTIEAFSPRAIIEAWYEARK